MKTKPVQRFLFMLLFATVGICLVGYVRPEPISSQIQKEKFWATKVHSENKYNVIFAGDSRIYRGVDPKTISKELNGLAVLNFGFSSGGHNPFIFDKIEKRIDFETENKIIVLGLTPYSLTAKAQENEHFAQEFQRDKKDVLLRRYVNPALDFFDPIQPTEIVYANDTIPGYYERFRNDGWVESRRIPYDTKKALKSYAKNFKNNAIDLKVVQQVLAQIKTWTSNGITVFVVRMPTTKEMEKLEHKLSGYQEYELKKEFENSGGIWLDYDNRFAFTSYDGSHLDGKGAKKFSQLIGRKIAHYIN